VKSLNRKYIAENSHRKRQIRGKQSFEGGGGGRKLSGMPPVRRSKWQRNGRIGKNV
jgi:hypothetical protein